MRIDGNCATKNGRALHTVAKGAIKIVVPIIEKVIPDSWLHGLEIDADQNVQVFLRYMQEYEAREAIYRPNRVGIFHSMFKFFVVLFFNDEYWRERIGHFVYFMYNEIDVGNFKFESIYREDRVGYDPLEWWGSAYGRGWKYIEEHGRE